MRLNRLLKKGVGAVASAGGPDAKSRDEGDAGAHRRGATPPQTTRRRRNRLRWLAFCSRRFSREKPSLREVFLRRELQKPDTTPASIFQQPVKHVYVIFCVLGLVLPYSQFVPWLLEHGLDPSLFTRDLFANRIGAAPGLPLAGELGNVRRTTLSLPDEERR